MRIGDQGSIKTEGDDVDDMARSFTCVHNYVVMYWIHVRVDVEEMTSISATREKRNALGGARHSDLVFGFLRSTEVVGVLIHIHSLRVNDSGGCF
jgi:hypothetical protein